MPVIRPQGTYHWNEIAVLQHETLVNTVAWNHTGTHLLTGSDSLQLWRIRKDASDNMAVDTPDVDGPTVAGVWKCAWQEKMPAPVHHIKYSPDGRLFATAGQSDRLVKVWFRRDSVIPPQRTLSYGFVYLAHPRSVTGLSWRFVDPSDRAFVVNVLLTSCSDGIGRLWAETSRQEPFNLYIAATLETARDKYPEHLLPTFHWLNHHSVPVDTQLMLDATRSASRLDDDEFFHQKTSHHRANFDHLHSSDHTTAFQNNYKDTEPQRRSKTRSLHQEDNSEMVFSIAPNGTLTVWRIELLDDQPRRVPQVAIGSAIYAAFPSDDAASFRHDIVTFYDWSRGTGLVGIPIDDTNVLGDSGLLGVGGRTPGTISAASSSSNLVAFSASGESTPISDAAHSMYSSTPQPLRPVDLVLICRHASGGLSKWIVEMKQQKSFSAVSKIKFVTSCSGHRGVVHLIAPHPKLPFLLSVGDAPVSWQALVAAGNAPEIQTPLLGGADHGDSVAVATPTFASVHKQHAFSPSGTLHAALPRNSELLLWKACNTGAMVTADQPAIEELARCTTIGTIDVLAWFPDALVLVGLSAQFGLTIFKVAARRSRVGDSAEPAMSLVPIGFLSGSRTAAANAKFLQVFQASTVEAVPTLPSDHPPSVAVTPSPSVDVSSSSSISVPTITIGLQRCITKANYTVMALDPVAQCVSIWSVTLASDPSAGVQSMVSSSSHQRLSSLGGIRVPVCDMSCLFLDTDVLSMLECSSNFQTLTDTQEAVRVELDLPAGVRITNVVPTGSLISDQDLKGVRAGFLFATACTDGSVKLWDCVHDPLTKSQRYSIAFSSSVQVIPARDVAPVRSPAPSRPSGLRLSLFPQASSINAASAATSPSVLALAFCTFSRFACVTTAGPAKPPVLSIWLRETGQADFIKETSHDLSALFVDGAFPGSHTPNGYRAIDLQWMPMDSGHFLLAVSSATRLSLFTSSRVQPATAATSAATSGTNAGTLKLMFTLNLHVGKRHTTANPTATTSASDDAALVASALAPSSLYSFEGPVVSAWTHFGCLVVANVYHMLVYTKYLGGKLRVVANELLPVAAPAPAVDAAKGPSVPATPDLSASSSSSVPSAAASPAPAASTASGVRLMSHATNAAHGIGSARAAAAEQASLAQASALESAANPNNAAVASFFDAASMQNDALPLYHPVHIKEQLIAGNFERVRIILHHLCNALDAFEQAKEAAQEADVASGSTSTNPPPFSLPPLPIASIFAEQDGGRLEGAEGISIATTDRSKPSKAFAIDDAAGEAEEDNPFAMTRKVDFSAFLTPREDEEDAEAAAAAAAAQKNDWISRLAAALLSVQLPGLTSQEQMRLLAMAETFGDAEKKQGAIDANGIRFLLSLKEFAFLTKTLAPRLRPTQLSSRDFAFALHSESQDTLLEVAFAGRAELSWSELRSLGAGYWLKNVQTLRTYCERIAKNRFTSTKNPLECALFFLAMKKKSLLLTMFKTVKDQRMVDFFSNDFTEERWQTAALKNAYALLGKQRFEHAVAFFLLAGALHDATAICCRNLEDPQLAWTICRLYEGDGGEIGTRVLNERLLPLATEQEDAWQLSVTHWLRRDYLKALECIVSDQRTSEAETSSQSSAPKTTLVVDGAVLALFNHLKSNTQLKNSALVQSAIPVERKLLLSQAYSYLNSGCPLLALDSLRKLQALYATASLAVASTKKKAADDSSKGPKADTAEALFATPAKPSVSDMISTGQVSSGDWDWSQPASTGSNFSRRFADLDDDSSSSNFGSSNFGSSNFGSSNFGSSNFVSSNFGSSNYGRSSGLSSSHDADFGLITKQSGEVLDEEAIEQLLDQAAISGSLTSRVTSALLCSTWGVASSERLESLTGTIAALTKDVARLDAVFPTQPHASLGTLLSYAIKRDLYPLVVALQSQQSPHLVPPVLSSLADEIIECFASFSSPLSVFDLGRIGRIEQLANYLSHGCWQWTSSTVEEGFRLSGSAQCEVAVAVFMGLFLSAWSRDDLTTLLTLLLNVPRKSLLRGALVSADGTQEAARSLRQCFMTAIAVNDYASDSDDEDSDSEQGLSEVSRNKGLEFGRSASAAATGGQALGDSETQASRSYARSLLKLLCLQFVAFSLQHFVVSFGFSLNYLPQHSGMLHSALLAVDRWSSVMLAELDSMQIPHNLVEQTDSTSSSQSPSKVMRFRHASILDSNNNPFRTNPPARRLWHFLVRQEVLQPTVMRFVLGEETSDKLDPPTNRPSTLHREHDSVMAFCFNSLNSRVVALATLREIHEFEIVDAHGKLPNSPPGTPSAKRSASNLLEVSSVDDSGDHHFHGSASVGGHLSEMFTPTAAHLAGSVPGDLVSLASRTTTNSSFHRISKVIIKKAGSLRSPSGDKSSKHSSLHDNLPTQSHLHRAVPGVMCLEAHPTLPYYLSGGQDGVVQQWQYALDEPVFQYHLLSKTARATKLQYNMFGSKFGATDTTGALSLWRHDDPPHVSTPLISLSCHNKFAADFVFLNSTSFVATAGCSSNGRNVALWDLLVAPGKAVVRSFGCHEQGGAYTIAYAPHRQLLVSGGKMGDVCVFDIRQRRRVDTFVAQEGSVIRSIQVDESRDLLATAAGDGSVKIWSLSTRKELASLPTLHVKNSAFFKAEAQGVFQTVFTDKFMFSAGGDGCFKRVPLDSFLPSALPVLSTSLSLPVSTTDVSVDVIAPSPVSNASSPALVSPTRG
ncbi:hypothetical protein, variant [Capsaspora owczarzaki ATCC 30864]|nr:hypothetical protein, variant [Capsaspora owczarzaki ATCC 30864]